MTMQQQPEDSSLGLYELFLAAMDDVNDDASDGASFTKLATLLSDAPQIQDQYVDFMQIQAGLRQSPATNTESLPDTEMIMRDILESEEVIQQQRRQEQEQEFAKAVDRAAAAMIDKLRQDRQTRNTDKPQKPLRLENYLQLGTIAAMILVALAIIWRGSQTAETPRPAKVLARITGVENAQWGNTAVPYHIGQDIFAQTLNLQTGLAELTFSSGAKVILEAPAEITLSESKEILLHQGKVAVNASGTAVGFAVNTENARVVDLSTEFGIGVNAFGETDIQVYQGQVELIPGWEQNTFNAGSKPRINLIKGQARRVNRDRSTREIIHNDVAFVREEEFQSRQKARQGESYHRWRAWSYQIRRDPDLVVYYPFERNALEPQTLFNYAAETAGRMNGAIFTGKTATGDNWVPGRWPDKPALHFDRARENRVVAPADMDFCLRGDITISVWLRCPEQEKIGHIISNRQLREVNYQLAFARQLNLHFIRYDEASAGKRAYSPELPVLTDEWHLLAVTYNNREVIFYLDGKRFQEVPYVFNDAPPVKADLYIGDIENIIPEADILRFNGDMDEIAIFRRILRPEEIHRMYEAGKPDKS